MVAVNAQEKRSAFITSRSLRHAKCFRMPLVTRILLILSYLEIDGQ
jgi:hypothetical protein